MTETTKQVAIHRDNSTVWSCDISKISLEQMQSLMRDVFNYEEKPPQILRINNVFFTANDLDNWLALKQGYYRVQWVR